MYNPFITACFSHIFNGNKVYSIFKILALFTQYRGISGNIKDGLYLRQQLQYLKANFTI